MGSNQALLFTKRFAHVKVSMPDLSGLKALKQLMTPQQRRDFAGTYGKILDLAIIEVLTTAITALVQYYDQQMRCFTFRNFQLVPMLEEFEKIVGCPLERTKPFFPSGHSPSMPRLSEVLGIPVVELREKEVNRNGVRSFPKKFLEDKARECAGKGEWGYFMSTLALLIYGVVLFPNIIDRIDLAAVDAFLAYYYRRESLVVAILTDIYCILDLSWEKKGTRVICCLSALYVWMVSHFVMHDGRPTCPLEDFCMAPEKRKISWEELLASMTGSTIRWFPRWKEVSSVLCRYGAFPNVPLMGTKGCVNYNPMLGIRQLGYPIRGPPSDGAIRPFIARGLNEEYLGLHQQIRKAWDSPNKRDKELRKRDEGVIGSYPQWLENRVREVKLPKKVNGERVEIDVPIETNEVRELKAELQKSRGIKEKLKGVVIKVRKECNRLKDANISTTEALEREMRRAKGEETNRKRYQGALLGNSNELKLRRVEMDQAIAENVTLRDELEDCRESKESLKEQLVVMEKNILVIVDQYEEKMIKERRELAVIHGQALRNEQAEVLALRGEREAREEVIELLHQESGKWMDRFALTLNESQELLKLLTRARAMADIYSTPDEVHNLFNYCQHMVELMTYIIKNR